AGTLTFPCPVVGGASRERGNRVVPWRHAHHAGVVRQHRRLDGRAGIDAQLVTRLIAAQFPHWSDLPVRPREVDG
ncbi:MAG: hypothetical protein ACRDQX_12345, partial [Pseudonocardiaceae bacterium]